MTRSMRRTAALCPAAALMLGTAACDEGPSAANAAAEAKAGRDAAYREQVLQEGLEHNIQCLSALRWQQDVLAKANIGDLDVYRRYYRSAIETRLADTVIPPEPPKPELSVANLDAYLDWAYPQHVETVFAAGDDANGDGTISATERSGRGHQIVAACLQEVAEMGEGPLAELEKPERMFRIDAVRGQMQDKGA